MDINKIIGGNLVYKNSKLSFILLALLAAVLFTAGTAMVVYADNGRGPGGPGNGAGGPPPSDNMTGGRPPRDNSMGGQPPALPSDNATSRPPMPPSDNITGRPPFDGSDNMTGRGPSMWDASDNMTVTVLNKMATILGVDADTVIAAFKEAVSETFQK